MEAEEESPHKILRKVLREVERTKVVPHLKLLPFGLATLPRGRGKAEMDGLADVFLSRAGW
jgi:hypothetical protein